MSRTGLSAAEYAEQFRDVCGDGSMEWVAGPTQTWLLLDAADMLDENERLRELVRALYMCSEFLCGRCKYGHGNTCDLDAENELRELGVEVNK